MKGDQKQEAADQPKHRPVQQQRLQGHPVPARQAAAVGRAGRLRPPAHRVPARHAPPRQEGIILAGWTNIYLAIKEI